MLNRIISSLDFLVVVISFTTLLLDLKKKKMPLRLLQLCKCVVPILLGRRGSGSDRIHCKEYGCNLQDTFRLIGCAIAMTSRFGIICVRCGLSRRVSALHSVVADFIFSGRDHGIHCWWDLIKSKQLSSVSACRAQVFAGFSSRGDSIRNIISQLKKENVHLE